MAKAPRDLADKTKAAARKAGEKAEQASPNPMTNLVIADIALRGGGQILRHLVERALLQTRYSPGKAKAIVKGRSMKQTMVGTALARLATRSVLGALVVGGGLLAKTLFDRRRGKSVVQAEGAAQVERQAKKGAKEKTGA